MQLMLFCLDHRVRFLVLNQAATESMQRQGYASFGLTLANMYFVLAQFGTGLV